MAVVALVEHVDEELVTEGDEATQEPEQEASTGALRTTEEQREETKAALLELLSTQKKRHPQLIKWLRDNHRMALSDGDALVAELIKAGLIERDENARYGTVAKRETTEAPLMLAERTGDDAPLAKVHEPEAKERSKEAPRPNPEPEYALDSRRLRCVMQLQRWRAERRASIKDLKEQLKAEKAGFDDLDARLDRIATEGESAIDQEMRNMPNTRMGQARQQAIPDAESTDKQPSKRKRGRPRKGGN